MSELFTVTYYYQDSQGHKFREVELLEIAVDMARNYSQYPNVRVTEIGWHGHVIATYEKGRQRV